MASRSSQEEVHPSNLQKVTHVAIIVACVAIVADVSYRYINPTAAQAPALGTRTPPPEYAVGDTVEEIPTLELPAGQSQTTLLFVVKSTCPFCNESLPFYQRVVAHVRSEDLPVHLIGVCLEDDQVCSDYFGGAGVALDRTIGVLPGSLKIVGTPTLILLEPDRRVEALWRGRLPVNQESEVLDTLSGVNTGS